MVTLHACDLRDAEVQNLHQRQAICALCEKEVRRLQVAMHNPAGVSLGDSLAGLQHVGHGSVNRLRPISADEVRQIATLKELHHHVGFAGVQTTNIEHSRNVFAVQAGCGPPLSHEPGDGLSARISSSFEHELESHAFLEIQVRRFNDNAHPADAQHALHAVLLG